MVTTATRFREPAPISTLLSTFVKRESGLTDEEVLALYENGIGSWIAENDDPEGEPENSAFVQIVVGGE